MTQEDIHRRIASLADQLAEHHTVLSADLPKDDEGFVKADGSPLVDALRAIDEAVTVLSRLAFKMAREA